MRYAGMTEPVLSWYRASARMLPWREDPTPYHIWVSEIMLQQTRIEAVKGYYARFLSKLPDVSALASADEETYLKLWEGLGYYNRVRNMHKAAVALSEEMGGRMPETYEELKKLPGIGDYTAAAIASIAFGECVPCVDGNVLRVTKRVEGSREDIAKDAVRKATREDLLALMEAELPEGAAGDFNQGMMEIGEVLCLPNGKPLCEKCPLAERCETCKEGNWEEIPVKSAAKARRIEERTIFLLQAGEKTALAKRAGKGLLAGLWELPGTEGALSKEEALAWLGDHGIEALEIQRVPDAKHIFSHVEWRMRGYLVRCAFETEGENLVWTGRRDREEAYALPSAFDGFRPWLDQTENL